MDAKNDLLLIIFVLIVLFSAWLATGGPERASSRDPFISSPAPLGSGQTYGATTSRSFFSFISIPSVTLGGGGGSGGVISGGTYAPARGNVRINGVYRSFSGKPEQEYVMVYANEGPVDITGWKLRSVISGKGATIGQAAKLPYSAQVNIESRVVLASGETAYITTGRSPIGTSFRTNTCTGYFEQFQDFTPALPRQCPAPEDELDFYAQVLPDICINFIEGLPRCEMEIAPPVDLPPVCNQFLTERLNYNTCVQNHKNDRDFYGRDWRLFLGRNEVLWKERRESIILLDAIDNIVDTYSY
jgi:hypothetical protein